MNSDLYRIEMNGTEGYSIISRYMSDDEAEFLSNVINQLNGARDCKYAPTIMMVNISHNMRENERIQKEKEAIEAQKRHEDLLQNGSMAQAFKKAMEKKKNR